MSITRETSEMVRHGSKDTDMDGRDGRVGVVSYVHLVDPNGSRQKRCPRGQQ